MVRPERVRVSVDEPTDGSMTLPCTVIDYVFQGPVVRFALSAPGRWFVKFIHMVPGTGRVDYESKWATLTFEVAAP